MSMSDLVRLDVNCLCGCPAGQNLIRHTGASGTREAWQRIITREQITSIICPGCGCMHNLSVSGDKVVAVAGARPVVTSAVPTYATPCAAARDRITAAQALAVAEQAAIVAGAAVRTRTPG